jgi:phage shock protein B
MEAELFIPIIAITTLFIFLPWLVFHYVTKWKAQATLTTEDENLLDELHELGRRLDERMGSIERIMTAEHPNWRSVSCDPASIGIEDTELLRRVK